VDDHPLLFDKQRLPKPACHAVMGALFESAPACARTSSPAAAAAFSAASASVAASTELCSRAAPEMLLPASGRGMCLAFSATDARRSEGCRIAGMTIGYTRAGGWVEFLLPPWLFAALAAPPPLPPAAGAGQPARLLAALTLCGPSPGRILLRCGAPGAGGQLVGELAVRPSQSSWTAKANWVRETAPLSLPQGLLAAACASQAPVPFYVVFGSSDVANIRSVEIVMQNA